MSKLEVKDLNEEWREVAGFESYLISNFGRLKKLYFKDREKICIQHYTDKGYQYCYLHKLGKSHKMKVHRLVAIAFIPNPNGYDQVNHKNGIKGDNEIGNLEWCSNYMNTRHAIEELGFRSGKKGVVKLSLEGEFIEEYESLEVAEKESGCRKANISSVCSGRKSFNTSGGFKWMYSDDWRC